MRRLLVVGLWLFSGLLFAQQPDVRGYWRGYLTQPEGGIVTNYRFELWLTSDPSAMLGRSIMHPEGFPQYVGIMQVEASWDGRVLLFKEVSVDSSMMSDRHNWCLKTAAGRLIETEDSLIFEGPWQGETPMGSRCKPGRFHLAKAKNRSAEEEIPPTSMAGRNVKLGNLVEVDHSHLRVEVFDNAAVDGDRVSLMFNGKWVLWRKKLKKKPYVLDLYMPSGQDSYLLLHAENLGKEPPNTAAVYIDDGQKRRKVTLSSDLTTSDVIHLKLK